MRVSCNAKPDYRSNTVGCVELDTTEEGLLLALRGVSSYREGYAPGPPAHSGDLTVPWRAVYATRIGPEALLLSLDARQLAHNRYLLQDFADAPAVGRGRALARVGRALLPPVAALLLGLLLLWPEQLSLLSSPPLASLVAAFLWVNGVALLLRRAWVRRRRPQGVLDELCQELAPHLPRQIEVEPLAEVRRAPDVARLGRLLPRSAVGLAVALAAASLGALVSGTAALPLDRATPAAAGRSPGGAPSASPKPGGEALAAPAADLLPGRLQPGTPACACDRQESLLWAEPPPRLSALVLGARVEDHHGGHRHTELHVALVNNGDRPIERPELDVTFYEARAEGLPGQRRSAERSLRFDRPLAPGAQLVARVEGRGTSFDLLAPDLGALSVDGSDAAPAEQIALLLSEPPRPLRLHAARLLAWVRDPRATAAALELRHDATPGEAAHLERLLATEPPVAACDAEVEREHAGLWRVVVCLHNRSPEPRRAPVQLLAFDARLDAQRPAARAPALLGAATASSPVVLGPGAGRRVELRVPLSLAEGAAPRAFEVRVDPEEGRR